MASDANANADRTEPSHGSEPARPACTGAAVTAGLTSDILRSEARTGLVRMRLANDDTRLATPTAPVCEVINDYLS